MFDRLCLYLNKRLRRTPVIISVVLMAVAATVVLSLGQALPTQVASAQPQASCSNGNVPQSITTDTTLSGQLYVTNNVKVQDGATLTLEPGTQVTVCGEYGLSVGGLYDSGYLVAEGTEGNPITFDGAGGQKWKYLHFGWGTAQHSRLRHVTISNAGGTDPTAQTASLILKPLGDTPDIAGPVVGHVTIRNSGAYGIIVDTSRAGDPTPPALSNLTIENSASAAIQMGAHDVGGLGAGNTFTGNNPDTVQVNGTRMLSSYTWQKQDVPYEILNDVEVSSDVTPTLTIEPGTRIELHPGVDLKTGSIHGDRNGNIVAEGTADAPITFDTAVPGQKWGTLYFGWGSAKGSRLRHVVLNNGGGNDPTATSAALTIKTQGNSTPTHPGPIINNVTTDGSGAYGVLVNSYKDDPTPPSLSNLTIKNSASAAMFMDASDVAGLGIGNTFTGNNPDTIQVNKSYGSRIVHEQTWLPQSVPYELFHDMDMRGGILTIEAGTTLLMHEGVDISVGSLYGKGGLIVNGTPAERVRFTRASDTSGPWGSIRYNGAHLVPRSSEMNHAIVEYAGGAIDARDGAIMLTRSGSLRVNGVQVRHSQNAGIYSSGSIVTIENSTIENNRSGVQLRSHALLRRNIIRNNSEGGLHNLSSDDICVDAIGNFWGAASGPTDASAQRGACNSAATNNGGNAVSEGVLYSPWLTSTDHTELQDASSISPEALWVIADGQDSTPIEITVRDAQGRPLAGKQIELETTRGTIEQPTEPTDERGITTASISSAEAGGAMITARNVTDNRPLAALGAVKFWQGLGETGGLIEPGGAPYASPQIVIEGQPFEKGHPMTFKLPMKNSNSYPVDVKVTYSVSQLTIGAEFNEGKVVEKRLQPGEAWDARAVWYPPYTGHRCVRATLEVTGLQAQSIQSTTQSTSVQLQRNFDVPETDNPCDDLDTGNLIPQEGGLKGVRDHIKSGIQEMLKVKKCIGQNVTVGPSSISGYPLATPAQAMATSGRDFDVIATPREYTVPRLEAGNGVTAEQATAATAVTDIAGELAGLDGALRTTDRRLRMAGQANHDAAAARQLEAYHDYQRRYADKLDELADAIDGLLAVTEGQQFPDSTFTPQDYQAYAEQLRTTGYAQETVDFHKAAGLTDAEIEAMRQTELELLEEMPTQTVSFYDYLRDYRDAAKELASDLRSKYDAGVQAAAAAQQPMTIHVDTLESTFTVGNPKDSKKTIDLQIRPIDLPVGWTYRLDNPNPTLEAAETTEVTLTIEPGSRLPANSSVRLAVEGYIGNEFVGGILFERGVPTQTEELFLPSIIQ